MNAMMITEGAPSDYNEWVCLRAKGWGYDNIKHYFLKTQNHALHKGHILHLLLDCHIPLQWLVNM